MNKLISEYRESLMGCCTLFVILFHQTFVSGAIPGFFHETGYLAVDVFFFVSGFGLFFSLNKPTILNMDEVASFYRRRLIRLMPTCIISGILFLYFWMESHPNLYNYWTPNFYAAFFGIDVWYIRTVLIYYCIAPFLFRCLKNETVSISIFVIISILTPLVSFVASKIVISCCGESLFMQQTVVWTISRFPAFTFGMILAYMNYNSSCILRNWKAISLAVISLLLFFAVPDVLKMDCFQVYTICKLINKFCSHVVVILPTLPFFILIPVLLIKLFGKRMKSALNFLGKYSLEVFLTHVAIFPYIAVKYGRGWTMFVIALTLSLLASVMLKWVSSKVITFMDLKK